MAGNLAPVPRGVPETGKPKYDRVMAPNSPGVRGPLRYEEGLGTDKDIPNDFVRGATEALTPAPTGANDINRETQYKHAAETLRERAHPGSAAWTDSPTFRGEFAAEANADTSTPSYEQVDRSGGRYMRQNSARIV